MHHSDVTVFDALQHDGEAGDLRLCCLRVDLVADVPRICRYSICGTAVTSCAPARPTRPEPTRFRMFATAAADSSHVYVSICDAGVIADIITIDQYDCDRRHNAPIRW